MSSFRPATLLTLLCCVSAWFGSTVAASEVSTIATPSAPGPDDRSGNLAVPQCADSGTNIFWPVFLTLFVVLVVALLAFLFWKYYWSIRHGKHLVLVTDVEKSDPEFAFDNPGFREGTPVIRAKKQTTDTKENSTRDDSTVSKSKGEHRHHASDNSRNTNGVASTVVPLKGRDFAGLGFGICGTKRDGIFVKDLLHHGPASESGRIKAGDRITAVRINFGEIEFKDAEDILRSASPYEMEIEIEESRIGVKRSFFRDQSQITARSQVTNLAHANGTATKNDLASSKPAVLEVVSEVSDKMSKYGVKVLPDITSRTNTNAITISQPVTSEKQTAAAASSLPITSASSTVVVVDPHAASFDEVDLPLPRSNLVDPAPNSRTAGDKINPTSNLVSSLKDANVKKALVMGYQNLKEKITQRVHKSNSTASPKSERISRHSQSMDDGSQVDDSRIEHIDLRLRSGSTSSTEADDPLAPKAAKRKAPRPPEASLDASSSSDERSAVGIATGDFNLLNEIDNEVKKNCAEGDSDSEIDETDRVLSTTIELNASHITIHHGAEDTSRKAASLGDLSKIEGDGPRTQPLERAVSLELAEHTPRASKKRKAPRPPEEGATIGGVEDECDSVCVELQGTTKLKKSSLFGTMEAPTVFTSSTDGVITPIAAPKLKKSSLFGTLEEAVKTAKSSDTGEPTTCGPYSMVSSTPLQVTRVLADNWHLPSQNGEWDGDNNDSEDETAPALPTSPIPTLPQTTTFVTEIDVEVAPSTSTTISAPAFGLADNEQIEDATLFTTAAELNFSRCADSKPVASTNDGTTNVDSIDDDSRDECSSMDTVKEMSRAETPSATPLATVSAVPPALENALPVTQTSSTTDPPSTAVPTTLATDSTSPSLSSLSVVSDVSTNFAATVAKFQNSSPTPEKSDTNDSCVPKSESTVSSAIAKFDVTRPAEESASSKTTNSRSNSSSSSTSSMSSTSTRSVNSSTSINGSARTSPRRFSSGSTGGVESRIKSPNATVKSPKLPQSLSPVRAVGSRIPVRANTEPSLKVSLLNKEDSPNKSKKYDGTLENGKANFVSPGHIANSPHKTTLSDVRHNGPNR